jgi:nitrate reductase / nitrite oxidoreductase, alpha subunit
LTPHSKWSIRSEYQDNLLMLSLSRVGPTMWMSPGDAAKIEVRDNDWVEAVNRNGVPGDRVAPDARGRGIRLPRTGTHHRCAAVRDNRKPLRHPQFADPAADQARGHAQNAFAFNYLGPTGTQRDEVTVVRRRGQEMTY